MNVWGKRIFLSVGVCYFFEVYVVVLKVKGLNLGFYYYDGEVYVFEFVREGDINKFFVKVCLG